MCRRVRMRWMTQNLRSRSALDSLVRAPDVSGLAAKKALKETRYPNNDETAALYTEGILGDIAACI